MTGCGRSSWATAPARVAPPVGIAKAPVVPPPPGIVPPPSVNVAKTPVSPRPGMVPPPPPTDVVKTLVPPPPGIVSPPHSDVVKAPVAPATNVAQAQGDLQKQGLELLEKSRLELNRGQTKLARTLAEEAFLEKYGVREQALHLLNTIDTEEFNQKQLAMNRNFESGRDAFLRGDFKLAYATFVNLDNQQLNPANQGRLRELMGTKEMQAELQNVGSEKTIVRVGMQNNGPPGFTNLTDMGSNQKQQVGPAVGKGTDGAMAELRAMENIQFQKLTAEGLEVQRPRDGRGQGALTMPAPWRFCGASRAT